MIDLIAILKNDEGDVTRHGCIALDHNGSVAIFSDTNMVDAMSAMFRDTKSLFRTSNRDRHLVREEILTNERGAWLSEMRRQLPSPYYGGPITSSMYSLDQIEGEYVGIDGEDKSKYTYKRFT